jgi:branched-chain amino acid transport system substrate-binding protein
MRLFRLRLSRLLAPAAIAGALAAAPAAAQDIRIGVLYPLTGGAAAFGEPALLGHHMLVDEINAAGGINGRRIVSIVRDSRGNPADATAAARELITRENVDFLVGGLTSAEGLAISEVARAERRIYIAAIPKTKSLVEGDRFHQYVFRTAANTNYEGGAAAMIAHENGWSRICTLLLDYAYGWDLDRGFKRVMSRLNPNAQYVLELRPRFGTTDWSVYITQLMGARCDVIFGNIFGGFFIGFAQQATPFGLFQRTPVIMVGEVGSVEIARQMGRDMPEGLWTNAYEVFYHTIGPAHERFLAELRRRTNAQDGVTLSWPVVGYVGTQFLVEAIRKAGSTDTDRVIEALRGLSIETPIGRQTIDPQTHEANRGQFWGRMTMTPRFPFKIKQPVRWIPAENLM